MNLNNFFFKYRGFTPIPFILLILIFSKPTPTSFLWGLVVMILGESFRLWGVSYAGGATRTRQVGANHLVTNGPFARFRNPLYVGNMFMYSGASLIANVWQPWLILAVFLFFSLQYYFIIQLEEEKLTELFGEEYQEYKKQVPKIIPTLRPLVSKHPVIPDFKGAVRSEKSTFLSFLGVLILFAVKMYFY